jgi:hypothetical protein
MCYVVWFRLCGQTSCRSPGSSSSHRSIDHTQPRRTTQSSAQHLYTGRKILDRTRFSSPASRRVFNSPHICIHPGVNFHLTFTTWSSAQRLYIGRKILDRTRFSSPASRCVFHPPHVFIQPSVFYTGLDALVVLSVNYFITSGMVLFRTLSMSPCSSVCAQFLTLFQDSSFFFFSLLTLVAIPPNREHSRFASSSALYTGFDTSVAFSVIYLQHFLHTTCRLQCSSLRERSWEHPESQPFHSHWIFPSL